MRAWLTVHRKTLYLMFFIATTLVCVTRYFVIPDVLANGERDSLKSLQSITDNVIASILFSAVMAFLLWWTKPPFKDLITETYVAPYEIDIYLRRAASETDEWSYFGHTARYIRSQILPFISESASQGNDTKRIKVIVLDPTSPETCKYYSDYRNRCRSRKMTHEKWDADVVASELLATILCLIELRASNDLLVIDAGLAAKVSLFRIDMSSGMALITQEDNQEPAIFYRSDTHFYKCYKREIEVGWAQAIKLDIEGAASLLPDINLDSSKNALRRAGIEVSSFSEDVLKSAVERALEKRSPYVH